MIRPYLRDLIDKHKPIMELNNNNNSNNNDNNSNNNNSNNNNIIIIIIVIIIFIIIYSLCKTIDLFLYVENIKG